MALKLSHLYKREVVNLGLFQVTVIEVPHGLVVDAQKEFIGKLQMAESQAGIKKNIRAKQIDTVSLNDKKQWLAIESWTLTDDDGNPVPVGEDAWRLLPHPLTEQIERAIGRLNPDLDSAFSVEDDGDSND